MLTTFCYLNVYVCTEMKIIASFKQTVWGQGVIFSAHTSLCLPVHLVMFCFICLWLRVCEPQLSYIDAGT
jgi:hypothetical protein